VKFGLRNTIFKHLRAEHQPSSTIRAALLETYENVRVFLFDAGEIVMELPCGAALVDHITCGPCAHHQNLSAAQPLDKKYNYYRHHRFALAIIVYPSIDFFIRFIKSLIRLFFFYESLGNEIFFRIFIY
jgi:hypothetical protein